MSLYILILFIAVKESCTDESDGILNFHHNEAGSLVARAQNQVEVYLKTAAEKIEERFKATTVDITEPRNRNTSSSEMGSGKEVSASRAINAEALPELVRSIKEINAKSNSRVKRSLRQDAAAPTPMEFIEKAEYPGENHYIVTPSGYILNLNRILRRKTGKTTARVAYLQHGIADSTLSFLYDSSSALAYVLADAGYDVWMGNARGNTYSRNHTTLDPDNDAKYWDFSWHEMGVEDLPAIIDYILNETGTDGVYYVGHSQGTTAFYVMASTKPEMNAKIKVQISMSPVGQVRHMKSPLLRILAKFTRSFEVFARTFGITEFLSHRGLISSFARSICKKGPGPLFCTLALNVITGYSPDQMNLSLIPAVLEYAPSGAAVNQVTHLLQIIASKRFRQFDFGHVENLKRYGSKSPPEYDLKKISAPVYLFYSTNDWISSDKDVDILYGELGNCIGRTLFDKPSFNHLDFMFGKYAPDLVYKKIVEIFNRY